MPELRARLDRRARYGRPERPYGQYQFSEQERPRWEQFWKSVDGDLSRALKYAENAKLTKPAEFVAALHRFLFWVWPGDPGLSRVAAKQTFQNYVREIASQHDEDPMPRSWYVERGCTRDGFVAMLQRVCSAADPVGKEDRDELIISQINARVPDLGFRLYEQHLLRRLPGAQDDRDIEEEVVSLIAEIDKEIRSFI